MINATKMPTLNYCPGGITPWRTSDCKGCVLDKCRKSWQLLACFERPAFETQTSTVPEIDWLLASADHAKPSIALCQSEDSHSPTAKHR